MSLKFKFLQFGKQVKSEAVQQYKVTLLASSGTSQHQYHTGAGDPFYMQSTKPVQRKQVSQLEKVNQKKPICWEGEQFAKDRNSALTMYESNDCTATGVIVSCCESRGNQSHGKPLYCI